MTPFQPYRYSRLHSGGVIDTPRRKNKREESKVQKTIKDKLKNLGVQLYRNSRGMAVNAYGNKIMYGLAKGGSDLIGWSEVVITPDMIGKKIAVFTAIEVKKPGSRPNENQEKFISKVIRSGGMAGYATNLMEAMEIVRR